ncbi:TlyA family RNA methyltransferase [Aquabacter spiritensis]|nr:TlyA family RNA methyltransferase [Aquabacter spiritensis]
MARARIDKLLVARGFFESRARAQTAIESGLVTVDGAVISRASEAVPTDAAIVAQAPHPFVSRGGVKLDAALDAFGFAVEGRVALDVGASTGGFTDVLLRRGARRVYAVDVGREQFHASLRDHPSVRLLESTDARTLSADLVPDPIDLVVADVSFISLALVLPAALSLVQPGAGLVALVKPQFEAGPGRVRKGIVRDPAVHEEVCARIAAHVVDLGWQVKGLIPSPITGGDGNREFLLGAVKT